MSREFVMNIEFLKSKRLKQILIASTAFSMIAAPVVIYADASAPGIDRPKMMKKKPRAKVKARARAQAKPQMQAPKPMQEIAQEVAPAIPEPVAVPEPVAQVVEAVPAPAAPAPVVKSGGSNWLLGVAAAAAVAAGIILATDGQSSPS